MYVACPHPPPPGALTPCLLLLTAACLPTFAPCTQICHLVSQPSVTHLLLGAAASALAPRPVCSKSMTHIARGIGHLSGEAPLAGARWEVLPSQGPRG